MASAVYFSARKCLEKTFFWKNNLTLNFGFWVYHFRTLSAKIWHNFVENAFHVSKAPISRSFFWNKVCVNLFVWKLSANNLDFSRYIFGRVVVTAFHMCRGFFPEENIFLKEKWLSKFVFGRWVKGLRTFVEKFSSSAFASAFRVCRGSFWGKIFLRKE